MLHNQWILKGLGTCAYYLLLENLSFEPLTQATDYKLLLMTIWHNQG